MAALRGTGVVLLNQSVLLRGVEAVRSVEGGTARPESLGVRLVPAEGVLGRALNDLPPQQLVFSITTNGPDDNLFEIGISSLTLTEIALAVDERYPGQLDISDIFDYPTLREIAEFLRQKT